MSRPLDQIYDREFFAQYSEQMPDYADACAFIAGEIARRFEPRTAIDWGCGAGLHVGALRRAGVEAVGVDGVLADPDLRDRDAPIVVADLTDSLSGHAEIPACCDLALCIDVLEHIDESESGSALANIVRGASLVILSCAPPGQGGHHHVNEQPRRYWVRRMAAIGWEYQRRETGAMERHFLGHRDRLQYSWMYHNLCVYRPASS